MTRGTGELLLGEWACLGVVAVAPTHGFAVAQRLRPEGDLGRVWSLSRALTYRALDQLVARGHLVASGSEPGIAGGQRTVLTITPQGRMLLEAWLAEPVPHLRDLRSELLLKLLLSHENGVDPTPLLTRQRDVVQQMANALAAPNTDDVVAIWRHEASQAALRFVDRLLG
ncbi:MAG TPA: helix-turn-helix transcriptional regulator [Ilumatobacteraceae bacterium]|nr:helix-turn-helix transcriptional regulator [Ilumatobacteraceae bacterium]